MSIHLKLANKLRMLIFVLLRALPPVLSLPGIVSTFYPTRSGFDFLGCLLKRALIT